MYGKKVKLRFIFLALILASVILTVFLILESLKENVVYFQSPSEIKSLVELDKKKIRIGGMVKDQSVFITSNEVNLEDSIYNSFDISYNPINGKTTITNSSGPDATITFFRTAEFNITLSAPFRKQSIALSRL